MTDLAIAQRLGRRMDHLLVDQSLFAWTHRILGFIAGSNCVLSIIATSKFLPRGFSRGYGGGLVAIIFFAAAYPFVASYSSNFDLVGEKLSETVWFAVCLAGISVIVDIGTVILCVDHYSRWWLLAAYLGQASVYVWLGDLMLDRGNRFYDLYR